MKSLIAPLRIIRKKLQVLNVIEFPGLSVGEDSKLDLKRINLAKGSFLTVGSQTTIRAFFSLEKENATVTIGNRCFINEKTAICCASKIEIGDDILIGPECIIFDNNYHSMRFSQRQYDYQDPSGSKKDWANIPSSPVKVCNKVWIGARSMIFKGVTIGEGAIVGAGSCVRENVPPWTIVAGNPAVIISEIPEEKR